MSEPAPDNVISIADYEADMLREVSVFAEAVVAMRDRLTLRVLALRAAEDAELCAEAEALANATEPPADLVSVDELLANLRQ